MKNHVIQPTIMKTNNKKLLSCPPLKFHQRELKRVAAKHHEQPKTTETNHQLWKSITQILSCPPVQVYRRESANICHHWGFRLLTLVYCLVGWGNHFSRSRNQHYDFLDLFFSWLRAPRAYLFRKPNRWVCPYQQVFYGRVNSCSQINSSTRRLPDKVLRKIYWFLVLVAS